MRKGTWVDPDLGNEKVVLYAKQFIDRRRKKGKNENTTKTYESNLRKHVVPLLGHRVAKTLKRRDSLALLDHLLDKEIAAQTVVNVFKAWTILVHDMIDQDVPLPANIVARVELPEVEPRVNVSLSPENVGALAVAMRQVEPRYEVLVWLAACAGLRQGEAFGLKDSAVGWQEDVLYVIEQRQDGKAVKLKTKASKATLPVDHFLIEQLAEHKSHFSQLAPVKAESERNRRTRGWEPPPNEGLLITNRLGRPVQNDEFLDKWDAAVELAGLPEETRYHDLKHFYTSKLGASGQHDPKTVQALSRHAQFSQTWDTYAHPPRAVDASVKVRTFSGLFIPADGTEERAAG
jgi:site-specific recombinase XerD